VSLRMNSRGSSLGLLTFGLAILCLAMPANGTGDGHDTRLCGQARGGTRIGHPTVSCKALETLIFLLVAHRTVTGSCVWNAFWRRQDMGDVCLKGKSGHVSGQLALQVSR